MPEALPLFEMRWTTSQVAKLLNIAATTLFGYRERYSFPGPITPGAQGGYQHDFVELCLIQMAATLTALGVAPSKACWDHPAGQIYGLIEDLAGVQREHGPVSPLLAVDFSGEFWVFCAPEQTLAHILGDRDAMVIINLKKIVADTLSKLDLDFVKESK